jgi:hypothetical protein
MGRHGSRIALWSMTCWNVCPSICWWGQGCVLHVLGGTPASFVCLQQAFIHLRYSPVLDGAGAAYTMHVPFFEVGSNLCQPVAFWECFIDLILMHVLQALWCRVSTTACFSDVSCPNAAPQCGVLAPTAWCAAADLSPGLRVMQFIKHFLSLILIHSSYITSSQCICF